MSNEIVKYNNELNFVPFNNFNKREFNILFVIISKLKDKGTKKTELSFNEIKKLSNYKQRGNKFLKDLENVYNKILSLKIWRESSNVYESWVLFTYYKIDNNNQSISIKVNPDLSNILNNLSRWTRFNLENFVLLNSTYSKTIFRLLKQYRVVGKRTFDLNNFKMLLGIPKSYRASDINKRVLQPIMIELSAYFKGLNIK
ncbi:replication initiation protein, partial [Apilactobacillus micheneri]|uniref:replication initiation protein n=1 Tax=Apilactobacillus micheneri TaxID=1899430 RepID=UPI00112DDAE7